MGEGKSGANEKSIVSIGRQAERCGVRLDSTYNICTSTCGTVLEELKETCRAVEANVF